MDLLAALRLIKPLLMSIGGYGFGDKLFKRGGGNQDFPASAHTGQPALPNPFANCRLGDGKLPCGRVDVMGEWRNYAYGRV